MVQVWTMSVEGRSVSVSSKAQTRVVVTHFHESNLIYISSTVPAPGNL